LSGSAVEKYKANGNVTACKYLNDILTGYETTILFAFLDPVRGISLLRLIECPGRSGSIIPSP
jgi:hypothetical protein